MRITNKYQLPSYVYEWAAQDNYDHKPGSISPSKLLMPPRMWVLIEKHWGDIEVDVSELLKMRFGDAIHDSFEAVNLSNCMQERRISMPFYGWNLRGKPDIVQEGPEGFTITDIKTTSVWNFLSGQREEDYVIQMSVYAYIFAYNWPELAEKIRSEGEICYVLLDWQRGRANTGDYPEIPVRTKKLALWSYQATQEYIIEKLREYEHARQLYESGEEMPECDDLWLPDKQWALMKRGNKRVTRWHSSYYSAQEQLDSINSKEYYIEYYPGQPKRCEYCNARQFCSQYERMRPKE